VTRLVLAAAAASFAAVAVLPSAAHAVVICAKPNTETYVCKDTGDPGCYLYGSAADTRFGVGSCVVG
jgi:hypothetical protein